MLADGGTPSSDGKFSPSDIATYYEQTGSIEEDEQSDDQDRLDEEQKTIDDRLVFLEEEKETITAATIADTKDQMTKWYTGNQAYRDRIRNTPEGKEFVQFLVSVEDTTLIGKKYETATEAEKKEYQIKKRIAHLLPIKRI